MNQNNILSKEQLEELLPLATKWVATQEKFILKNGVSLDPDQQIDAYKIGVKDITKVRLYEVTNIPKPSIPQLKNAVDSAGFLSSDTIGVSFRYGIYIKSTFWNQRRLIVHELTHTMQYERAGGIQPFLELYLNECLTVGYPNGPLEKEARKNEKEICTQ